MDDQHESQLIDDSKIMAAERVSVGLLVAFEDGTEYIYTEAELRALIPKEFDLAKQIKRLIA
jgi:hypothetical protein